MGSPERRGDGTGTMSRRLVFLELNEVPWKVLDDFVATHPRSSIAELLASSDQYVTVSPDQGHLSPWITWPTVHRGVDNSVHGIGHLGQETEQIDRDHPPYWTRARAAGRSVGVFGPLHTHPLPDDVEQYSFWLPDTFASAPDAHPAVLEPFQAFNLTMARASARNVDTGVDGRSALRFLISAPRAGLRPSTVKALLSQLGAERRRPWTAVRRRSLQSVLAFDLFLAQLRKHGPDLAVVFTNHVASAMHRYWAARYPHDYDPGTLGFDEEWQARYGDEIDVAMAHADRFIGRLLSYVQADPRCLLIVGSSMGQAAAQGTPVHEQLLLRDADRFVAAAGVSEWERRPAMDPMVSLKIAASERSTMADHLGSMTVDDQPLEWQHDDEGLFSVQFGQADAAIGAIRVAGREVEVGRLGLERVTVEDEAASSGYHVPEGSLLVHDPMRPSPSGPRADRPEVPTTAIAPAVLDALGVATDLPGQDGLVFDLAPADPGAPSARR